MLQNTSRHKTTEGSSYKRQQNVNSGLPFSCGSSTGKGDGNLNGSSYMEMEANGNHTSLLNLLMLFKDNTVS